MNKAAFDATAVQMLSLLIYYYLDGTTNSPMIQNTVDPAEARMKSGRLIKKTSPYCSTRLNSRPTR